MPAIKETLRTQLAAPLATDAYITALRATALQVKVAGNVTLEQVKTGVLTTLKARLAPYLDVGTVTTVGTSFFYNSGFGQNILALEESVRDAVITIAQAQDLLTWADQVDTLKADYDAWVAQGAAGGLFPLKDATLPASKLSSNRLVWP